MTDQTNQKFINEAKATGGYCLVGRYGVSIHSINEYGGQSTLSGYDLDGTKAECVAAGLPTIDTRDMPFDKLSDVVIKGPLIGLPGDVMAAKNLKEEGPWLMFDYAPFKVVAKMYHDGGAEVINVDLGEG